MTKVSGLDLSMTATGITYPLSDGPIIPYTGTIKPVGKGDLRLPEIARRVADLVKGSELVLIEGYLNKSFSAGITGMVHGAVRARLIEEGLTYGTMPPASLKKYATGKGNASKTEMAVAAVKRAGLEFKDDNECDSWWLWVAARDHLGDPCFPLPSKQREALDAVKLEAG